MKEARLYCSDKNEIDWQRQFTNLYNDVHMYFFDTGTLNFPVQEFVTAYEIKRAKRFYRESDSMNFLYGRGIVRLLLAKYKNTSYRQIIINTGHNKKPYACLNGGEEPLPIKFNLSHSANGLLLAFALTQVGCDIEYIATALHNDVMENSFTNREAEIIINSETPQKDFFKTWAKKEAVLKYNGAGLIDDLKQLQVCDDVNVITVPELQPQRELFLTSFFIQEKFAAAFCYESDAAMDTRFFDGAEILPQIL